MDRRNLVVYSPRVHKGVRHDLATKQQQQSLQQCTINLRWVLEVHLVVFFLKGENTGKT